MSDAFSLEPVGMRKMVRDLERTRVQPLFDLNLLRSREIGSGSFLMIVASALMAGGFFVTSFYLRLRVADQTGVLARITGILAEHDISIDAVLQREAGDNENQTDLIILTHDTEEGRMNRAMAQMQALPTVLQPIVRIRKEELS